MALGMDDDLPPPIARSLEDGARSLAGLLEALKQLRKLQHARVAIAIEVPGRNPGDYPDRIDCLLSRVKLIELLEDEQRHVGEVLLRRLKAEYEG